MDIETCVNPCASCYCQLQVACVLGMIITLGQLRILNGVFLFLFWRQCIGHGTALHILCHQPILSSENQLIKMACCLEFLCGKYQIILEKKIFPFT
jgi:hypothetical protein